MRGRAGGGEARTRQSVNRFRDYSIGYAAGRKSPFCSPFPESSLLISPRDGKQAGGGRHAGGDK